MVERVYGVVVGLCGVGTKDLETKQGIRTLRVTVQALVLLQSSSLKQG